MSQVIINDVPPYTQAIAIGGQTVFGTNWTADAPSDVIVYHTPYGDPPNDFTQILSYPSQYSVTFVGALEQVQVTLVTPANQYDRVTVVRMTPADRENLYTNTNFTPSMLNSDFGILTLVDQQAQLVNQSIAPRYNYSAIIVPIVDTILPILGANQIWAKNSNNTGFIAIDLGTVISSGTVTEVDTGVGLTGGPITTSGTISFAPILANSFWANITGGSAVPTQVSTSFFLQSANNLSDLTNTAAARTNIGLAIGVNVEAWSPALDSIAGLTTVANNLIYTSASNTYTVIAPAANSILITSAGNVPSLSQTLPTIVQTNITQLGAQSTALNMNSHKIINVTDPTNPQDSATKAYVDAQTNNFLPITGGTMQGIIDMGNHKITNMADPTLTQDAVTLNYLNTQLAFYLPLSGGTMAGQVNMGSNKIVGLATPTNGTDAATKAYVDSVALGFAVQPACYAATDIALTATYSNGASGIGATLTNAGSFAVFSVDGVSPPVNSRVLVWIQASSVQNGIYTVTNVGDAISVNWILTRATDYDQPAEIQPGDLVVINNGTLYGGTSFIETATVTAVGTDAINFSQFTFSSTQVLLKANNLSDVANKTTSFNNISPLTTKGDLIAYSTQNVRLAVGGTNGQILQVNSGAATGLAWSTATFPSTTTANQILYSSSTNVVGGISTLAGGVLVTDATSVPQFLTNPGVAGKILQSANGAIPAWSTPTYPSTSGTSGKFIISDGTNNVYSTSTIPSSAGSTSGKIIVSDGTNYVLSTPTFPNASAVSGKMIVSDGTNWIPSTPTFPNASATTRKIIVSDGTNWVASTETYATPGSSGNIMTSDGTNWTSAPLSTAGLAHSGANSDITSMTGLTGVLQAPTFVNDSNGNHVLGFGSVASAVNYLNIVNAATGGSVSIQALGSDSSIPLLLQPKNTSVRILDSTGTIGGAIALFDKTGSHATTLSVSPTQATNLTLVLPAVDGSAGYALITNGSGILSFQKTTTTSQILTSSSGTYTTPAGCTYLRVRGVAGGGGGAGSTSGGNGNNTTFSTLTAHGGTGGSPSTGLGGAGGTGGTSAAGTMYINGQGGGSQLNAANSSAGFGGSSMLGGGSSSQYMNTRGSVPGYGGGGCGGYNSTGTLSRAGGGGGEGFDAIINSPAATYSYGVGTGGGAGSTETSAARAGGDGVIFVDEFYA